MPALLPHCHMRMLPKVSPTSVIVDAPIHVADLLQRLWTTLSGN
ncbi:MAG: hypothetical protein AAGF95_14700 [Chloroflexota bacterium]